MIFFAYASKLYSDCKLVLCSCCGESDIIFDIYSLDGTYQASVTTGRDGCQDVPPIGPYTTGTSMYFVPRGCEEGAPRTYYTITCCPFGMVDTVKVLCCPGGDHGLYNNVEPGKFDLFQNYPNPFNPKTKIAYNLPEESFVKLTIYDVTGKKVATLIDGIIKKGYNELNWDASNLSSGIYFYKLEAGSFSDEKKMILIK